VDGDVIEVMAMFDAFDSVYSYGPLRFNDSSCILRTNLNNWYSSLTSKAKEAIVEKTFVQDQWYNNDSGSPIYKVRRQTEYTGDYDVVSLKTSSYSYTYHQNVYTLSIQDIIDYLGVTPDMTAENTTFNYENIHTMLGSFSYIWLSSTQYADYIVKLGIDDS